MSVLAGLNPQRNNELSQEVGDWGDMHDPTIGDSLNPTDILGAVPRVMARSSMNMLGIPSAMALSNIPAAIDKVAGTHAQDWWFKHTVDPMIEQSDRMLPDPSTTHVAMQTIDSLLGFASEMAMSGGPINFGILSKITSEVKELHAGKDLQTARNISDLTGFTNMVFAGMPMSVASKAIKMPARVQGAISGAVGMDVIGSVSEEAHKQALEAGGYHDEAQQHDWNTWQSHAFNLAFGGITGAIHPHVLPSHKDALLTINEAHAIQNPDGLSATNPAANNALVDNMNSAVQALANDKPVTSALNLTEGFIQDPAKGELEQQIAQYIAEQHKENNQQAIDEFSKTYPDIVKGIVNKQYQELITRISDQAGWAQRGGEITRSIDGEVTGRTNWLPRQEWFGRFVAKGMGNQASLQKAVNKFISGEKLGPKQSKMIDWLKDEVDGKNQEGDPESFTITTAHDDLNNRILEHIESIQEQRRQEHSDKTGQFIHDDIVKQLEDAGHYDAEKNSAFARLQQIVFVNQAKEAGMSPRAFWDKYGNTRIIKGGDEDLSDAFGQVLHKELPETEFSKALDTAQKNAALPLSQGGLGLPANNTAMDRAKAMGFEFNWYHATSADIKEFDLSKFGKNDFGWHGKGVYTGDAPDKIVAYSGYSEDLPAKLMDRKLENNPGMHPNIMPLAIKSDHELTKNQGAIVDDAKNGVLVVDYGNGYREAVTKDPRDIRSRFAAFDPMNKNSANVLAQTDQPRLAPNGKTSNLNPMQHDQVRTEAFKKWFGDWEIAAAKPARVASNFDQAKKSVKDFQGKPLENQQTGMTVTLSRNNLDKMLSEKAVGKSESAAGHSLAVANLDDLFSRAILGWSKPDRDANTNIASIHRFFAPLNAGGKARLVKMTVKEFVSKDQGNKIYTVESIEMSDEVPAAQWVDAAVRDDNLDPTSIRSAGAIISLAKRVQKFKDNSSKVVDENGEPLVVYHGTNADFDTFKADHQSDGVQYSKGFFFTSKPDIASNHGDTVMPVFLKANTGVIEKRKSKASGSIKEVDHIHAKDDPRDIWIVFNDNQIKSATGNNGNFDNADPNILHQSIKGAFHPDFNVMSLFKSADASTFLHESGHQFLELYNNMRMRGDASAVVKADMDHLLNWFGIKDFDAWLAMSLEQQRPYHEQFAKGFETYLAEGKAPAPELQGIFKNFAQWLKQVYSDIQGKLGVNLTDDVRGVMDRIIHHGESEPMKSDTPEITAARESIPDIPADKLFEIEHDDGSTDTGTAAELMARADQEAAFAEQSEVATNSAITCFLKFGDL